MTTKVAVIEVVMAEAVVVVLEAFKAVVVMVNYLLL